MAAALKLDPPPTDLTDSTDDADSFDLVPGTLKAWRTKEGTPIGVTGRLTSGEWVAMTDDETITVHDTVDDASLRLTLAYMRRPR